MNAFKTLPIMPVQASDRAAWYDGLFFTITGLSVVFTILVFALVLFLAAKYKRGSKADRRRPIYHSVAIEGVLTFIPLVLGLGIFAWSAFAYIGYRNIPKDSMEIFVIGKQWMWHLQHMNGIRENNELHVPVDTPVKLTMISQDVIHAMYLPEFRAQYHVVPGRYTELGFTAVKTGTYRMLCAMHCGTQHSEMVGLVHVMSKKDFAEWIENNGNRYKPEALTMAERGAQVWKDKGCGSCHVANDNVRAPSVAGIYGKERRFTGGSTAKADADYLRESILNPYLRLTEGYAATMPAYRGQMSEENVLALVEYMKTLSNVPSDDPADIKSARPATKPTPSSPENAVDIANRRQSAGATQNEQGAANQ